jgi:aerobic-type carbon monoxide dehydrogenase small subunit (CoxS/CutS family)
MTTFTLNGKPVVSASAPDTPLLWVVRDELGLTGTKFGCGMALCGACTVHLDDGPIRSCVTPIAAVAARRVVTIEGIGQTREGRAVQQAWIQEQAPQCGYCQSGQVMSAVAFLRQNRAPTREQTLDAMSGNVCRCGTYNRIAAAVDAAAKALA